MKYRFRAAQSFWRSWSKLSREQQQLARQVFPIFRQNPFDPRLRTHKIHRLSAHYGRTIYAVDIAGDLRAAFYTEGATIWSVSIGTHDIYKG
jgi:mRNA-degrading endonuclease YafQ of YafQ-DinJ toxin-antitoxin module